VPPAGYSGGAPYGTPGTVAGIAGGVTSTGAGMTPPGMTPPGMGLPRDTPASTSSSTTSATPAAERRRARYDCASCHY
jgi:hypothetical protein